MKCAVLTVLAACAGPAPPLSPSAAPQAVVQEVVVVVNSEVITKTEIDERLRVTSALAADAASGVDPAILTRVLRDAVDERLILQHAAELGLSTSDADVDRVLARVRAESRVERDDAFDALLRREDMSLETLRATTRRQLTIEQVRQRLFGRVAVSEEEALRYFQLHRGELGRALVTYRELRIAVPPFGTGLERERARAIVTVVQVRDRLAAGADFAAVARDYAEAGAGGAADPIGPIEPGALEREVAAALAGLQPGGVTGPVELPGGYRFLKLEAMSAASRPAFHEHREAIVASLLAARQRAAPEDLLSRLRRAALLQWKRRDLELAYDRPSSYR